jgi:predicted metal-dependent hydrolase
MNPIVVRQPSFDFMTAARGIWNPKRPELSHLLNAFQLALPYLEPYFIDAVKRAAESIGDPLLKADAAAFCAQEANHARQHKRYCESLHEHYPRLEQYEAAIRQSMIDSRKNDRLEWRVAYTAGYEVITAQFARILFEKEDDWLQGADQQFASLMLWHAAEELEHRHVAFEVLQAVNPDYKLRAHGLYAALKKTYADMTPVATYMLEVDHYAGRLASHVRRTRLRAEIAGQLVPAATRYLMPGYHPSQEHEPTGYGHWQKAHGTAVAGP